MVFVNRMMVARQPVQMPDLHVKLSPTPLKTMQTMMKPSLNSMLGCLNPSTKRVCSYGSEFKTTDSGAPDGFWWTSEGGRRLLSQYMGQYNVQTDIKECIFVGCNDALVACGSDDGDVFIYNAVNRHACVP